VPDRVDTTGPIGEALSTGMREELREAQRERWRAEVRLQAALEQMRHFEKKTRDAEEEVGDLRALVSELAAEIEAITGSKAWKTAVRVRSFRRPFSRG
jgi:predicted RNase H-like nuclease (RuvC/YqgF family)